MQGYTLCVSEIAEKIRFSERSVQRWFESKKIPYQMVGRSPYYLVSDVVARYPKGAEQLLELSAQNGGRSAPADMKLGERETFEGRIGVVERSLSFAQERELQKIRSDFSKTLTEVFWTKVTSLNLKGLASKLVLHPVVTHALFGDQPLPTGQAWRDFSTSFALTHSGSKAVLSLIQTKNHETFQRGTRV